MRILVRRFISGTWIPLQFGFRNRFIARPSRCIGFITCSAWHRVLWSYSYLKSLRVAIAGKVLNDTFSACPIAELIDGYNAICGDRLSEPLFVYLFAHLHALVVSEKCRLVGEFEEYSLDVFICMPPSCPPSQRRSFAYGAKAACFPRSILFSELQ